MGLLIALNAALGGGLMREDRFGLENDATDSNCLDFSLLRPLASLVLKHKSRAVD